MHVYNVYIYYNYDVLQKLTGEWEIKIKLELRIGLNITRDEIQNNHTEWLTDIEHAVRHRKGNY